MKKNYTLLLITILLINFNLIFAQQNNDLPNHGLTHSLSAGETFNANDFGTNFRITNPPIAPVRNIAEFEPAEAVLIAYASGFGLPYSVIKDLSNSGHVIIAAKSSNQTTALNLLTTNGVNTANCSFLTATVDSWWTRDYSGWFIADSSNHVQVVDFTYNRSSRPNDDSLTKYEAALLGTTYYGMNLKTTGGNWMCDGYNGAVSTVLVQQENTGLTTAQIQQDVLDYLGINNYMIVPDALGQTIEHIDCWAKFLAPDKILVDSVPSTDSRYSQFEAAAAYFASTNCSYNYPYKVYRTLIDGSSLSAATQPYSNSFIFNNRVFVPIGGGTSSANDTAALIVYRNAMPGYIVKGYTSIVSSQVWLNSDALHCRTHEIADSDMLYIQHYPLFGLINYSPTGYDINAKVVSYGGYAIAGNYPMVKYRINYNGQWDSLTMGYVSYLNYKATIPAQNAGDTVYYYIKAKDVNGKTAYHALMGQADPHFFIIGTSSGIQENNFNPEISFFTYPNPSKGSFILFTKSNYTGNASVKIFNVTGSLVYNENFEMVNGNSMKSINAGNLSQGIYMMEVRTKSNVLTKQLVIQ